MFKAFVRLLILYQLFKFP